MGDYVLVHPFVNRVEVVDLLGRRVKLLARGRSRSSKSIVIVEDVGVVQMDFLDPGLRNEVENVGASSAKADDDDFWEFQLLCASAGLCAT